MLEARVSKDLGTVIGGGTVNSGSWPGPGSAVGMISWKLTMLAEPVAAPPRVCSWNRHSEQPASEHCGSGWDRRDLSVRGTQHELWCLWVAGQPNPSRVGLLSQPRDSQVLAPMTPRRLPGREPQGAGEWGVLNEQVWRLSFTRWHRCLYKLSRWGHSGLFQLFW